MPSLVGNKPNQVPSNGDLGTMAFREQEQFVPTSGIGSTVQAYSPQLQSYATNGVAMRNRIINGAMTLSQRNGTSAVTIDGAFSYTLDRFACQDNTDGSYTVAQSSVAPAGFTNSLLVTITGTDSSLTTTQFGRIVQRIESFNTADLGWGTANAKTVTLSFWVRSSVTGTFSGTLVNNDGNRIYAFTYTINAADTFEYKTITIAGDTTGTWTTNNTTGIELNLSIGAGPDRTVAAGSWGTSLAYAATGQTNLFATSGATFYITGVQLEVGTQATSFEYRQYGTELNLCQRYYQKSYPLATLPGASVGDSAIQNSWGTAGSGICGNAVVLPVSMRASPTLTVYDVVGNSARVSIYDTGAAETNDIPLNTSNADSQRLMVRIFGYSASGMSFMYTVSAEL
jgi:hypothetical protein